MKNKKIQNMTYLSLLLAFEIILVITPLGYIPIGPLSVTTMHIPVIIAGIILGKKQGAQLGFVFGFTSFLNATFRPTLTSFCFSPFVTIGNVSGNFSSLLIAFIPRILLGYLTGLIFEKLNQHKSSLMNIIVSSICGSLLNTFLVLAGIYFFFGHAYASSIGVAYSTLISVLLGVVFTNGIVEAILATLISLCVYRAYIKTK